MQVFGNVFLKKEFLSGQLFSGQRSAVSIGSRMLAETAVREIAVSGQRSAFSFGSRML